jgi:hypothetical protein
MDPVSKVALSRTPAANNSSVRIDVSSPTHADTREFSQALQRHMHTATPGLQPAVGGTDSNSLSSRIAHRATDLANEVQKDQQYVSKMLEQATQTGDQMTMMKAMLALTDYQTRVQFVSKTISKSSTSVDQLTRMQ